MKLINVLVFFYLLSGICIAEQIQPRTIVLLYENREHLAENFFSIDKKGRGFKSKIRKKLLDSLYDSSLVVWEKNEAKLIGTLIPNCREGWCDSYLRKYGPIKDSITIKLLVSILDLTDYRNAEMRKTKKYDINSRYLHPGGRELPSANWVADAINWLIHLCSISSLNQHSDLIKTKLKYCKLNEFDKIHLLVLLKTTDSQRNRLISEMDKFYCPSEETRLREAIKNEKYKLEILKGSKREKQEIKIKTLKDSLLIIKKRVLKLGIENILWIRTRLGDEESEKRLLSLTNSFDYFRWKKLIGPLSLSGSKNGIRSILKAFDKPIITEPIEETAHKKVREGYFVSLRLKMITELSRHFPHIDLFNEEKLILINRSPKYRKVKDEEKYIQDFSKWAKNEFNVNINYKKEKSGPFIDGILN